MTKKHFEAAARIVNEFAANDVMRETMAYTFVRFFAGYNPRFDRERFLAACGVPAVAEGQEP